MQENITKQSDTEIAIHPVVTPIVYSKELIILNLNEAQAKVNYWQGLLDEANNLGVKTNDELTAE